MLGTMLLASPLLTGCASDPSVSAFLSGHRKHAAAASLAPGRDANTNANASVSAAAAPNAATAGGHVDSGIDVDQALHDVMNVPHTVASLRDTIFYCTVALVVVGALNLGFLAFVLRRVDTVAKAGAATALALESGEGRLALSAHAAVALPPPVEPPAAPPPPESIRAPEPSVASDADPSEAARSCACGAEITPRSKTGRCRRCAQIQSLRARRAAAKNAA